MKKRKIIPIFLLMVLITTACGAAQAHQPVIAILLSESDAENYLLKTGFQETAEKASVSLVFYTASGSLEKEAAKVNELIAQHVQSIIFEPVSLTDSLPAFEKAQAAGIPLVCLGDCGSSSSIPGVVRVSPRNLGALAGDAMLQYTMSSLGGKAQVGLFGCQSSASNQAGCDGAASHLKLLPGTQVVSDAAEGPYPDLTEEAQAFLSAHPELNLVWAAGAKETQAALQAVQTMGLSGKVALFGTGMSQETAQALLAGDDILQGVVDWQPYLVGTLSLRMALDWGLDGQPAYAVDAPPTIYTRRAPEQVQAYLDQAGKLQIDAPTPHPPVDTPTPAPYNPSDCGCNPTAHPALPTP
jgi:ABC-type sugar transport system substrate-binding protein